MKLYYYVNNLIFCFAFRYCVEGEKGRNRERGKVEERGKEREGYYSFDNIFLAIAFKRLKRRTTRDFLRNLRALHCMLPA